MKYTHCICLYQCCGSGSLKSKTLTKIIRKSYLNFLYFYFTLLLIIINLFQFGYFKMRRQCGVGGCTGEGVKFSPKSSEQRDLWKKLISYTGRANTEFVVCQSHFSPAQFHRDREHELIGLPPRLKNRMKPDAVPDCNLGAEVDQPNVILPPEFDHPNRLLPPEVLNAIDTLLGSVDR